MRKNTYRWLRGALTIDTSDSRNQHLPNTLRFIVYNHCQKNHMNRVAVITGAGSALEIVDRDVSQPGPGEVLVKNEAIAIQPLDAKMLHAGYGGAGRIENYPTVLGTSGAGTIQSVGADVSGIAVGDRVVFDTRSLVKPELNSREGTWQKFVIVSSNTVAKVNTMRGII